MLMQMDEARGFVMQALRESGWNQMSTLVGVVVFVKARSQGINPNLRPSYGDGRQYLDRGDQAILNEVIWSLIIQGVLVPGLEDSNPTLPFIRLTEYGQRCVAEDRLLPHDPEGYLREFQKAVPGADATILEYLTESLQCYIHGLHRASAVMLGAASEQAILLLIDSSVDSIADVPARERFKADVDRSASMFRKYEIFERRFSTVKSRMPKDLTNKVDSLLRGVFDLIRNSRNDAGHPASGAEINRDAIYSHLKLFVPYCQRIYGLIGWFLANQT
jgi:hypothetical protein